MYERLHIRTNCEFNVEIDYNPPWFLWVLHLWTGPFLMIRSFMWLWVTFGYSIFDVPSGYDRHSHGIDGPWK